MCNQIGFHKPRYLLVPLLKGPKMSQVKRDDSDSFACLIRNLARWSHGIFFLSSQQSVTT